jgi:hypothetical protein
MAKSVKTIIGISAGIIAVLFLSWLAFSMMQALVRMESKAQWSRWMNKVYVASQLGSNTYGVEFVMGKPWKIEKPSEVLNDGWKPQLTSAPKCEKVYVYMYSSSERSSIAYIFLDSTGHVVGSHIGRS